MAINTRLRHRQAHRCAASPATQSEGRGPACGRSPAACTAAAPRAAPQRSQHVGSPHLVASGQLGALPQGRIESRACQARQGTSPRLRQRRLDRKRRSCRIERQGDRLGMQQHRPSAGGSAVLAVTPNRVADARQVDAQLMGTARAWPAFDETAVGPLLQHPVIGGRRLAGAIHQSRARVEIIRERRASPPPNTWSQLRTSASGRSGRRSARRRQETSRVAMDFIATITCVYS